MLERSASIDDLQDKKDEAKDPSWYPSFRQIVNLANEAEPSEDIGSDQDMSDTASISSDSSTTVYAGSDSDMAEIDSDTTIADTSDSEIGTITLNKARQDRILNDFSISNILPENIDGITLWPNNVMSNVNMVVEAPFSTHSVNCDCPCMRGFDWEFPTISIYQYLNTHVCPRVWPQNLANSPSPVLILTNPTNRFCQLKFLTHQNQTDLLDLVKSVHELTHNDRRMIAFALFELEGQPHDFCLTLHIHCIMDHERATHNILAYNVFNFELRHSLCRNTLSDVKRVLSYEVDKYMRDVHALENTASSTA